MIGSSFMQDAFAYCAELVRTADRDRFLAHCSHRRTSRRAACALCLQRRGGAGARGGAEPLPGEIRLQWWSEVLRGERAGEASANPVASALLTVIERYRLASAKLTALIDARCFDLYDDPMARLTDLEAYASKTSSALIALAACVRCRRRRRGDGAGRKSRRHCLRGRRPDSRTRCTPRAGSSTCRSNCSSAMASSRRTYSPADPRKIFARYSRSCRPSPAATFLRPINQIATLPDAALPAFLPVALARPALDRLARRDPFAPVELSPWRRQWLIWRAARNPARLAG